MAAAKQRQMQAMLKAKLDSQGGLLTQQRSAVYAYLRGVKHHPTAEEVFWAVKRELPKISLATVYKNLEALVACGAASKLTFGSAAARYDIRTDHHYHTRCLKCSRVRDVEPTEKQTLAARIKAPTGFQVEDYRVELIGYCRQCQ